MSKGTDALKKRCQEMYQKMQRDAMLQQGSPVDDLMAFVIAETGRSADTRLDKSAPLCLYFKDDAARDEFIQIWRKAKRGRVMVKKLP